ncbi:MAG: transglutaminase family protein [Clostridiales bacterium]|jgi:transglutaminase-like putative cysteine protease|nr:transglutaminase family protein [Clostridiales bacterium]
MDEYLRETAMLNYSHERVKAAASRWSGLPLEEALAGAYYFVRDKIVFGFNPSLSLLASEVLEWGCGQSVTKAALLMALLRSLGIPCRYRCLGVSKSLYSGIASGLVYAAMPERLPHAWAEVFYKGRWLSLEGAVVDLTYITRLQSRFSGHDGRYIGHCVAPDYLQNPRIEWRGAHTYIQSNAVIDEIGVFPSPDDAPEDFFKAGGRLWALFYRLYARGRMNDKLNKARLNKSARKEALIWQDSSRRTKRRG